MNKISLSAEAQRDLQDIKCYISVELDNMTAAVNTVKRITAKIKILSEHPMAGAALTSITAVDSDYRFLVAGNYLVFYRFVNQEIFVDRILYGRRNYLRILFGDFVNDETEE